MIGGGRQKVLENPEPVRAIKTDQIKARRPAALGRIHEPAAQVPDVLFVQSPRLHRVIRKRADRHGGRRQWHLFGVKIRPVDARIGQLNARQRAVGFDPVGHPGDHRDVGVVPEAQLNKWRNFGRMVHLALFGKDDAPAAFGLDPAHFRRRGRVAIAAAVAVRHLIEAVLRRHRTDVEGLEQNVVSAVSRHGSAF